VHWVPCGEEIGFADVVFGLMATKQLRNVTLFTTAKDYGNDGK
jgi:hypothetical protein